MWQRFTRMLRSIFGALIGAGEDPERLLEQNLRDMNDQIPKMNAHLAMVRANLTLVEKEAKRYESEVANLTSKIKAALSQGREDVAMEFAMRLESIRAHAENSKLQADTARKAYEKALEVKKAFMREKERKTRQAMDALRTARQAKWQAQVADAMKAFEPAGLDATHEEMVSKVEQQAALDQAKLDMALDHVDVDAGRLEEDAERLRAGELLAQFKVEMGIAEPQQAEATAAGAEAAHEMPSASQAEKAAQRTIASAKKTKA